MLISKGKTFMSMFICGILPRAVNIPLVLLQEGLPPEVAGQLGWETWISVNRANPFLPPCQSYLFRKPKCNLSTLTAEVARLAPGAL